MWPGSKSKPVLPKSFSAFFKYDSSEDLFQDLNNGTCICDKGIKACTKKLPDLIVQYHNHNSKPRGALDFFYVVDKKYTRSWVQSSGLS